MTDQVVYCENCRWCRPAKSIIPIFTPRAYALEFARCGHPNAQREPRLEFLSEHQKPIGQEPWYCSVKNSNGHCQDYAPEAA